MWGVYLGLNVIILRSPNISSRVSMREKAPKKFLHFHKTWTFFLKYSLLPFLKFQTILVPNIFFFMQAMVKEQVSVV